MTWLYDNAVVHAIITASSNVLGRGVSIIKDKSPRTKLKFTGRDSEYVELDLGAPKPIGGVALFGHNFTSEAIVAIEANDTPQWNAPAFRQVLAVNSSISALFNSENRRYWRLTIQDPTNVNDLELGVLYLGAKLEIASVGLDANIPKVSVDVVSDARSGQVYGHNIYQYYAPSFSLLHVTEEKRSAILSVWSAQHQAEPWVLIVWEDSLDKFPALYVRFTMTEFNFTKLAQVGLAYSSSFSCREVL